MFKKFKLPVTILILLALFVGFTLPVTGADHFKRPSKINMVEKGDDPWDPGDESDPFSPSKSFEFKSVSMDPSSKLAKRDNDPWDPGDESPRTKGVTNV